MSRIGKQPVKIPDGVTVSIKDGVISAKGPKGSNEIELHKEINVVEENGFIIVSPKNPEAQEGRALWGLFRALIANLIEGVEKGFEKKMEMVGVGYKANVQGDKLVLDLAFSHQIELDIPKGVECNVNKNNIAISGVDKQAVGAFAAKIRSYRKPEPYKGKGIKYEGEVIRRKAGKAAKSAGA